MPAMAAAEPEELLLARVSHSCDAPYSIQVALTNPGKRDILVLPGSLPWSANYGHMRIRGYEVAPGRRAKILKQHRIIADYFSGPVAITAGTTQSGQVDLSYPFADSESSVLGETPVLVRIDFPEPRKHRSAGAPRPVWVNAKVVGPAIDIYFPVRGWFGAACPVVTVRPPS